MNFSHSISLSFYGTLVIKPWYGIEASVRFRVRTLFKSDYSGHCSPWIWVSSCIPKFFGASAPQGDIRGYVKQINLPLSTSLSFLDVLVIKTWQCWPHLGLGLVALGRAPTIILKLATSAILSRWSVTNGKETVNPRSPIALQCFFVSQLRTFSTFQLLSTGKRLKVGYPCFATANIWIGLMQMRGHSRIYHYISVRLGSFDHSGTCKGSLHWGRSNMSVSISPTPWPHAGPAQQ